jgi:DNA-binding NarL/FixJ family response regulator
MGMVPNSTLKYPIQNSEKVSLKQMKKLKALIVEDEIIIAEDINQVLTALNYDVVGIALKYSQAIEILDKHEVDFVLIDIILGGTKTGIDLAATINEVYKVPFVFLTSHADAATVKKAKAVSPIGYILKPFTKDNIFTTLKIALSDKSDKNEEVMSKLSEREYEVYEMLAQGLSDNEIADKLFVSQNTIKTHLKSIYKKLNVKNRLAVTLML